MAAKMFKECGRHSPTSKKHTHYRVDIVVSKEVVDESTNTQFSNEVVDELAIGVFARQDMADELASLMENFAADRIIK